MAIKQQTAVASAPAPEAQVESTPQPAVVAQVSRHNSPSIAKISSALVKAQGEFPVIPKTKTAKVKTKSGYEYEYHYADLADVFKVVQPILAKHGLAISQPTILTKSGLRITTKLIHESGEWMMSDGIAIPENLDPQVFGSVFTYWRRYDGCGMLGIAPDEDDDGKGGNEDSKGRKQQSNSRTTQGKEKPSLQCAECNSTIGDLMSGDKVIPASVVAAKAKEKFGKQLCGKCAMSQSKAGSQSKPQAHSAKTDDDGKKTEILEGPIEKLERKQITAKGEKKTIWKITLNHGTIVTDWHKSHHDLYQEADKGTHVKMVVEVKPSGQYVNRDVKALMEIGDLCVEDEDGNKLEEQQEDIQQNADMNEVGEQLFENDEEEMPWDKE